MGRLRVCCSCLAVVLAAFVAFLRHGGIVDGTLPSIHAGPFGYTAEDIPDLNGKTIIVTGATSGLGLGVARHLQRAHADLILTARSAAKCAALLSNDLDAALPAPKCVVMELMSLAKTRTAADELLTVLGDKPLNYLVLNAGIMSPPTLDLSEDGYESQFATNHLGHFVLLAKLRPALKGGRVVAVSSLAHWAAPSVPLLTTAALNDATKYKPMEWYGWSKVSNILMLVELMRQEMGVPAAERIIAHAVHPGGVRGKLNRFAPMSQGMIALMESSLYWDEETGALTVLKPLLAVDAEVDARAPAYFVPIGRERNCSKQAMDAELALKLWKWSEELAQ